MSLGTHMAFPFFLTFSCEKTFNIYARAQYCENKRIAIGAKAEKRIMYIGKRRYNEILIQ